MRIKSIAFVLALIGASSIYASELQFDWTIFDLNSDSVQGESGYRKAIFLNNIGRGDEATKILRLLVKNNPSIERYKLDYIAVSSASGNHLNALGFVDGNFERTAPVYVQDALLNSAIATNDSRTVYSIGSTIIESRGAEHAVLIKLSMFAIENGDADKALYFSKQNIDLFPEKERSWDARGYILRKLGNDGEALLCYQEMRERFPDNPNAPKAISMILLDFGAPHEAGRNAAVTGHSLSADEKLRIMADKSVHLLRWSPGDDDYPPERYMHADRSISGIVEAIEYAIDNGLSDQKINSLKADLAVAYRERRKWHEVVRLYEELEESGFSIPEYTKLCAASAYGAIRQFEKSEKLFSEMAAINNNSFDIWIGWVYSLSSLDRFDEAERVIDLLISELSNVRKNSNAKAAAYTSALNVKAMLRAYQDRLSDADNQLNYILGSASAFTESLESYGVVSSWRGHPRKAEEYYRIALEEAPLRIDSKMGLANARMDRGDVSNFRKTLRELYPEYSDIRSVIDGKRREELHDRNILITNYGFGNSFSGISSNRDWSGSVSLYSKPFYDDGARAFARYRSLNSGPDISVRDYGIGAGIALYGIDKNSEIELGDRGYFRVEGNYSLSDKLSFSALGEKNAFSVIPRAALENTQVDSVRLLAKWRENESFGAEIGVRKSFFSDGNNRTDYTVSSNYQFFVRYNQKLTAYGFIGVQNNSSQNVPYFSPESQAQYTTTFVYELLQARDMETKKYSLWHRFWLGGGLVNQKGFGYDSMNSYGYGQEISLSDAYRFRWGIGKTTFPFDGEKSSYHTGYIGFEGRF